MSTIDNLTIIIIINAKRKSPHCPFPPFIHCFVPNQLISDPQQFSLSFEFCPLDPSSSLSTSLPCFPDSSCNKDSNFLVMILVLTPFQLSGAMRFLLAHGKCHFQLEAFNSWCSIPRLFPPLPQLQRRSRAPRSTSSQSFCQPGSLGNYVEQSFPADP